MRTIWFDRTREEQYGGSWTLYIRLGRLFFEINFGRDRALSSSSMGRGDAKE